MRKCYVGKKGFPCFDKAVIEISTKLWQEEKKKSFCLRHMIYAIQILDRLCAESWKEDMS